MRKIRLALIDDHNVLRQSMRKALSEYPEIDVVGSFSDGRYLKDAIEDINPDVLLMDIVMPRTNGLHLADWIRRRNPRIKIVIFTMHDHEEYVRQALKLKVAGYVLKDSFLEDVVSAIKSAENNHLYLSPAIAKKVIEHPQRWCGDRKKRFGMDLLSPSEKKVLRLIAEGYRMREVAEILHIAVPTAETHRKNLMGKLDLHNSSQVTRYAIRSGLVDI